MKIFNKSSFEVNDRGYLLTEQQHKSAMNLDLKDTSTLVNIFCEEDLKPQEAVSKASNEISTAITFIVERLKRGGRLFYIGCGTSGRLGILDAAECPPTFCTPPDLVQAVIAGGDQAVFRSSEEAEDNINQSIQDLLAKEFSSKDCLVGITAGGTTPYVLAALSYARNIKALSIAISCVPKEQNIIDCDVDIRLITGPELITGSTRMKSGTATKMTLNIISTVTMIRLGKVFGNRMVDLSVSNEKLLDRSLRILIELLNVNRVKAYELLEISNGSVKIAIIIHCLNTTVERAESLLKENSGNLRLVLKRQNIILE